MDISIHIPDLSRTTLDRPTHGLATNLSWPDRVSGNEWVQRDDCWRSQKEFIPIERYEFLPLVAYAAITSWLH